MRKFNLAIGAMLLLMACTGNKGMAQGETATGDSAAVPVSDTLVFESVTFEDSSKYKVKVVDYSGDEEPYPYTVEETKDTYEASFVKAVAGKPEVVEFINQWITLNAAGKYVEKPVTAKTVAAEYAKLKKEEGVTDVLSGLKKSSTSFLGGNLPEGDELMEMPFVSGNEYSTSIYVMWETPNLLTLWDGGYEYAAGGAHGMPWGYGTTFDLKNLRELAFDDIITQAGHEAVMKMIIAQLQEEYGDTDMLNAPGEIGFPGTDPALDAEGVRFDYGAYEIGPYALGMPGVVIPYEKMKPYLTPEVKELLDLK